jgi:hypothetical protein
MFALGGGSLLIRKIEVKVDQKSGMHLNAYRCKI